MASTEVKAAARFGYGVRPGQPQTADPDDILQQLTAAPKATCLFPLGGEQARLAEVAAFVEEGKRLAQQRKAGEPDGEARKQYNRAARQAGQRDQQARVAQAVLSPYGFHERLASFWVNHFAVSLNKGAIMSLIVPLYETQAIRPNLAGRFVDLLTATALHPAMLRFLDQVASVGPHSPAGLKLADRTGVNENFAREVMELHTLGVNSGYQQADVRQMALLLTGLSFQPATVEAVYRPRRAEPGEFTVLGKTYERSRKPFATARSVFEDLAADPRTARHISAKLVYHFITEEPKPDLVAAMAQRWQETGGELAAVYRVMLESPLALAAPQTKIKLPFDYTVSVLRALGASQDDLLPADTEAEGTAPGQNVGMAMAEPMGGMAMDSASARGMGKGKAQPPSRDPKPGRLGKLGVRTVKDLGQPIWSPSDAAGFKDASETWSGSSQLAERISFVRRAVGQLDDGTQDPRDFAAAVLGDTARPETTKIVGQAPNRRLGLLLAMISPEFNRR
ncbi:DUF1800 domain-containing protein [Rhizobium halophytocola]|uniref:Uncharacterized protein (DUF1800 family) n=1 Tax=Rhizobium halophytocola TaxID=735519 RepID=A0ABS4DZT2_9HYPH|nr:DUF1800 domain-containing protein [Rhizobium halophytocola]MBP1851195.1 uncharacterized protein (DUF1800 family) [Rhizobium halophytocola]